ncbi:MAG: hypothetical protein HXY47_02125 [Nitrospirae bacterium]|nr:hypothetical protein [Nitrospirota bacterium]
MKNPLIVKIVILIIFIGSFGNAFSKDMKIEEPLFSSSLRYTGNGMAYWYSKTNGGLEILTGIPYSNLDCKNCHVATCEACHRTVINGKPVYSKTFARKQDTCLHCHKREASVYQIDISLNQKNVHSAKGFECMDCHTAREIHGDGIEYKSMKQPGAMDTKCENCHEPISSTISHKVHRDRLDCKACHVRHVISCFNCHFDTLLKEGKRVAIPLSGWVFLMNYNGKVTSANMQTFVVAENKTFLMFAPQNSHSIMKDGRKCDECHATDTVKKVREGKLSLTWFENNNLKNVKGVIPVVDGVIYESVYQNYQDGKWIPIDNPALPLIHYAAFGEPLSKEQLKKMSIPMGKK